MLGSPPSHIYLIVIIRLCERAILVRLHHEVALCGTRWLSCKPVVLVTLGGCHLLDSLVVVSVEARKKLVRCSGEVIVRGIVLTPREPQRATLVERVIEIPSLVGRFLRCLTSG